MIEGRDSNVTFVVEAGDLVVKGAAWMAWYDGWARTGLKDNAEVGVIIPEEIGGAWIAWGHGDGAHRGVKDSMRAIL